MMQWEISTPYRVNVSSNDGEIVKINQNYFY